MRSSLIALGFVGFIALGLEDGLLGVVWPAVRGDFDIPLDGLGLLLATTAAGFLLASFLTGGLVARFGVPWLLVLSSGLSACGLFGYATAETWFTMVAFGVLIGMGAGALDGGLNAYLATSQSAAVVNLLHGCYGLGAALGPVVATITLASGASWRVAYGFAAMVSFLLAVGFGLMTRTDGRASAPPLVRGRDVDTQDLAQQATIWLRVGVFLVYAGIEATAGQWAFSLFTEARNVEPVTAGWWVSIYWAVLGVGRLLYGVAAGRIGVPVIFRVSMLGTAIGAALVSLPNVGAAGLMLLGFALSPIFPSLIATTRELVRPGQVAHVVGFQVGAARLGSAVLPGLAGVLAIRWSLEVIGPVLITSAVLMMVLYGASKK